MGKVRVATLGDEQEKEQRRRADARRQTKKSKKEKVKGVGLKGGERVAVVEGTELKPEIRKLVEEVEEGKAPETAKAKPRKVRTRARSSRYTKASSLVDKTRLYPIGEAVALVKQTSYTRFDGTVELHLNLTPSVLGDAKDKKDYRGSVNLPHGTGKQVRVAIADDKLVADIEAGKINFDVLVAHPSMMAKLAKVARVLGPKGLMPNPKMGTVTQEPEKRAKELSSGTVQFKSEPGQPIVHLPIGKVSFDDQKLIDNTKAIIAAIGPTKIVKATLTATMGPGVKVAVA